MTDRKEGDRTPRMPIRDRDLRRAATDAAVRPGDPGWRLLRAVQRLRDRGARPRERVEAP